MIGDQGLNEGGFAHAGLHGLVGCISAAATGADCAAGALGGVVQSVYAGTLEGKGPAREDYASDEAYAAAYGTWEAKVGQTANLIGGVVGYALSGGSAANVSATASIAKSGILNNYLWHQQAYMLEQAKSDLAACEVGGGCSDEELGRYRERIAYFEGLDAFTDQQLRAQCDADPTSATCKAYVADALCASEQRMPSLCGGEPIFGVARWGYGDINEIWKADMFANGRHYSPGFEAAANTRQHQQDTLDLLAEFADSVNAVRGNDSIGIAIELGGAVIGARIAGAIGGAGRVPKGGGQALTGSFGERQFQLSRGDLGFARIESGASPVLPPRYTRNADGSITGPAGGRAWETGYVNELGQQVFQRASGGYYVVGGNGAQIRVASPKVHGNTLNNTPTEIYRLVNLLDGTYLKTGISNNAMRRYAAGELGFEFDTPVIGTRPRAQAAAIERFIVERWPGPLNHEPFAGKRNPTHPNYDPSYIPDHMRGN